MSEPCPIPLGPRPPSAALDTPAPAIAATTAADAADQLTSPAMFFQPDTSRTLARFFQTLRVTVLRVIPERSAIPRCRRFRFPLSLPWLRVPSIPLPSILPRTTLASLFSPRPRPRSILRDLHAAHVIDVFRGRSLLRRFRGLPPKPTGSSEC